MSNEIAQEYVVELAKIWADRELTNGPVDVSSIVMEISLFESLDKQYISGQLVLLDDAGIMDEIQIQGTEKLVLDLRGGDNIGNAKSFTIDAVIVSITGQFKEGDKQEIYGLNFVAPHAYDDETIKISKSYTGKLEEVAETILLNELGIEVERSDKYIAAGGESTQAEVRVITPYVTPLEAVTWLLSRATGDNGSPFMMWQSLQGKDPIKPVRLGNLKDMIENGILECKKEARKEFVYSVEAVAAHQDKDNPQGFSDAPGNTTSMDFLIKEFKSTKVEDTLKMVKQGAVGSMVQNLDISTTQKIERHFKISEVVEDFDDKVFDYIYDDKRLDSKGEKLEDLNSRYRSVITSFGTYGSINSYHDVFDQVESLNKVKSQAIMSSLYKNMIEASFHGVEFWNVGDGSGGLSVGDVLEIEYVVSTTDDNDALKVALQRSGYYLVHDLRHTFQMNRHEVTCTLCKVRNLDEKPIYEGHSG